MKNDRMTLTYEDEGKGVVKYADAWGRMEWSRKEAQNIM